MYKINQTIMMLGIAIATLLCSCSDKKVNYVKVDIIPLTILTESAFNDTIVQTINTFVKNEDNNIVPLVTLKSANRVPDFVLTKKLERGEAGFNGDPEHPKVVKSHISKEVLPNLKLPKDHTRPFVLDAEQVLRYERRIKEERDSGKICIKFSSNPEDTTAQVHNVAELADLITREAEKSDVPKDIVVYFNMPFVRSADFEKMTVDKAINNNEFALTKAGLEKQRILDQTNSNIGIALDRYPYNVELWYQRAVNRTYAGVPREAIEYLENAAKVAIEKDSAFMIMDKITENEGTKLKFLAQTQSSKFKAVKNALEKSSVDLIGVIRGDFLSIAGKKDEILYLNCDNDIATHKKYNFSVAISSKDATGTVTLNINAPENIAGTTLIRSIATNQYYKYGEARVVDYDNGHKTITIINESPIDKKYVKLRVIHTIKDKSKEEENDLH